MGGMFTLMKVRDKLEGDPGWYLPPEESRAKKVPRAPKEIPT
jgi:hypothetical protein